MQKTPRDSKIGVLLVNVGSPEELTLSAIGRYLRAFLGDNRVVELPRWLWSPLLYGVISIIRPFKVISRYRAIWTDSGSPLLVVAQKQAMGLRHLLVDRGFSMVRVECAMTYGRPSLQGKLNLFLEEGIEKIFILPLYPQYSGTTTGAVFDGVARILMKQRVIPEIHFYGSYYREPAYVQAIASSIKKYWDSHGRGECLIFSFHGLPKRNCDRGDPYFEECCETVKLVSQALELDEKHFRIAFQSRFGRARWLEPNLLDVLKDCATTYPKRVDVVCPGFSADCLETLEEINIRARVHFQAHGGRDFHYIPALNASISQGEMLFALIQSIFR